MELLPRSSGAMGARMVLVLSLSLACRSGDPGETQSRSAVATSSNSRIVIEPDELGGAVQSAITFVEDLTIGSAEGAPEYALYGVPGAPIAMDVDRDGDVFVLVGGTSVRVYGPSGDYLRQIGRKGNGPGELRLASAMSLLGDQNVVIYDGATSLLTVLGEEGELISTVRLRLMPMVHGFVRTIAPLDSQTLLVEAVTGYSTPRRPDRRDWTLFLLRVRLDGSVIDTMFTLPREDVLYLEPDPGDRYGEIFARPFARGSYWAVSPGGTVAVGNSSRYEIDFYDETGTLRQGLVLAVPARSVTSDDLDAFREQFPNGLGMGRLEPRTRRRVERAWALIQNSVPDTWPSFDKLVFDSQGRLWVRRPAGYGDATAIWDVFSEELNYLGSGRLPSALDVRRIQGRFLYALWSDPDGVRYVKRYRIGGELSARATK